MYRDSIYIIYHTSIYVVNTIFHDTKKWHPKVKKEQPSLSESCSLIYSSFFLTYCAITAAAFSTTTLFPRYFLSCRRRQIKGKNNIPHKNSLFFFIYIPQIILVVYYIKAVSDCLYTISTTHFPGQQYLFSRIRDDKFDFPEFSLHHFLKPLCFHSIRNRGIGIIKMCQQHCLWFKPL